MQSAYSTAPTEWQWDLEIKTVVLIPARIPDHVIVNKNTERACTLEGFILEDNRIKERKQKWDKNLDHARKLKKKKNTKQN